MTRTGARDEPRLLSRLYNYARARELEGTFPRDVGCSAISAMRVMFGWGGPTEDLWPYDPYGVSNPVPEGLDRKAKRARAAHYRPMLSLRDIKVSLASDGPVLLAVDMTTDWFDAPGGRIPFPPKGDLLGASHAVLATGYSDLESHVVIKNSWGASWGSAGYGYLPYSYCEKFLIEAWVVEPGMQAEHPPHSLGHPYIGWEVELPTGNRLIGMEVYDPAEDERQAWAMALVSQTNFELFEFYVRPRFRRRGIARVLADLAREAERHSGRPLRAWIPAVDDRVDAEGATAVSRLLGIPLEPYVHGWVSRRGTRSGVSDPAVVSLALRVEIQGPNILGMKKGRGDAGDLALSEYFSADFPASGKTVAGKLVSVGKSANAAGTTTYRVQLLNGFATVYEDDIDVASIFRRPWLDTDWGKLAYFG